MASWFFVGMATGTISKTSMIKGNLLPVYGDMAARTLPGVMFRRGVGKMARLAVRIVGMIECVITPGYRGMAYRTLFLIMIGWRILAMAVLAIGDSCMIECYGRP